MIVLLAEDDEDLRRVLETAVPTEFELRSCSTGTEALRSLTSERIDVLMTDLDLPNVSGEQLVRVARALPRRVGVVVFSGHVDRLDACRSAADAALQKPFALSAFWAALQLASDRVARG
jgi:DNA-binding response OmpR family regulator